MNQDLLRRAEKLNKVHKSRSRMNRATRILSLVIALSTVYALMLPAITINNDTVCGMEEHTHTEACYAVKPVLICGKTEAEPHAHTDECYTLADGYICGQQEVPPHVHTDNCYGTQNRLTCPLKESEEHTHTESCYTSEKVLRCTINTEGHIHGPECKGQEKILSCGREATEGHTHSNACYEDQRVLVCGMEEHTHTEDCYPKSGDDTADVESKAMWEATLTGLDFTDDWTQNVLMIAASQLGYTESEANFRYVNGEKKGYSRYGEWYGDPYGDWCAMFVSFCLRYGGVPKELFPSHSTCRFWAELLYELSRFVPAQGAIPRPGDVVFFDTQEHISPEEPRIPDHVGLVFKVAEDKLTTIEGNINNSVVLREYDWNDPTLFGYGLLPEKPVQPDNEKELTDGEELTGEEAKLAENSGEPQDNDDADEPKDTDNADEPKDTDGESGEDKELSEELFDSDNDNDNDTEAEKDSENDTDKDNENENGLPEVKTQNIGGTKLLAAAMSIYDASAGLSADGLAGDAKAFFVTACVELAGLKESVPCFENCAQWAFELVERGLLKSPADGYIPAPGDLVLFDLDADSVADSIGIVTDADSESGELVTLESDAAAQVGYHFYKLSDAAILGYYSTAESAVITENTDAAEDADEKEETEEKEETSISAESEDGVTVTVTGQLPEDAQIILTPVSEEELAGIMASVEADTPLFAYDITIVDGEGKEWQPGELGVSVSITGLSIPEDAETEVTHVPDDGEITQVEAVVTEDTVEFTADGFSIYVVYYVGKEAEIDGDSTTLHFENELISADLTVSPKLSEDAAFSIEKIDRTLEAEKWEKMSAPVLETLKAEQGEAEEIPTEESAETEKEEDIQLYALKLTADGQELSLDENYAVKLEAKLNVTAPEEEEPEPGEAIRIFALNHEEENREQKNETLVTEDLVSDDPLAGIIPEALVKKASDTQSSQKKYTATPLKASLSREQQSVGVDYTGEGLDGLAMLTATLGDAPEETPTHTVAPGVTITKDIAYHKQIDWYGDKTGATTTDKDKYRLYLDAGPLQYSEPMDLLIVVDRSQSMSNDFGGISRGAAVTKILNGTESSATDAGLISRFLSLHKDNEVAVIAFFGDGENESFNTDGVTTDTAELLDWTDKKAWAAKENKYIDCRYPNGEVISCTDYCAAYLKMASMLNAKASDEKQKMVIFLSDGVPTYYLQNKDGGGYVRLGSGSPTDAPNVSECAEGTESFFTEKFGALAPIYPVAIGSAGGTSFSTDVLKYMSVDGAVRTAENADGLSEIFENIIYGAAVQVSKLTISDTLSDYVDMLGNITVFADETKLYERTDIGTERFEDKADSHAGASKFVAPMQSLSFDPETKVITAELDAEGGLDTSKQYILSFDVKTNASAAVTYKVKGNQYTDTGDEDTDYGENKTSSKARGFYSNKEAALRYKLNTEDKTADYPKPVVQVAEDGESTGFTIHGYITQHKTIDWLGDNKSTGHDNPDTTLDNGTSSLTDFYRLYLDAGQYAQSAPLDVLFIVDRSGSMYDNQDVTIAGRSNKLKRDAAVSEILNGGTVTSTMGGSRKESVTSDGLISKILAMNPENKVAIATFRGDPNTGSGSNDSASLFGGKWISGTAQLAEVLAKNGYGTNYNAGLKTAHDLLENVKSDGHKKIVIFLSDGIPTYDSKISINSNQVWSLGNRIGNGSEEGDNPGNVSPGTIEVIGKFKDYLKTFSAENQTEIYTIGLGAKIAQNKGILDGMCTTSQKTFTVTDYDGLLGIFEQIIYGSQSEFKSLGIADTLSEYVELCGSKADIQFTVTNGNGEKKILYQRSAGGKFTDTAAKAGKTGNFTENNNYNGVPFLQTLSYDPDTKTIKAEFNPAAKLEKSSKYELSYNVQTTLTAAEEYAANLAAGKDGYNDMTGDANTDYPNNDSSSGKSGFRSNDGAVASYSLGSTKFNVPYDFPVVQTEGSQLSITVTKEWHSTIEDEHKVPVTVRFYSAAEGTKILHEVKDDAEAPIVLTLNADNEWTETVGGLKRSDGSGNQLSYYIIEDHLAGYITEYYDPVFDMTLNETGVPIAGKVNISEITSAGTYTGTAKVINNPAILLPETGGRGEALYTDFGIMLLVLGCMLLIRKSYGGQYDLRRRGNQ